jgi:hypothetical protein
MSGTPFDHEAAEQHGGTGARDFYPGLLERATRWNGKDLQEFRMIISDYDTRAAAVRFQEEVARREIMAMLWKTAGFPVSFWEMLLLKFGNRGRPSNPGKEPAEPPTDAPF